MRISKHLTVILFLVTMVALLLVGCAEEILAPRELKTQVKISISSAAGPVDHGWLTIDNDTESRHRMNLIDDFLQSETISLLSGLHHFEAVAVDAEEIVLYRGAQNDTIPTNVDAYTVEIQLIEVRPDCAIVQGTTDFGEVLVGDSVTGTLTVANGEAATGVLIGEISLQSPASQHFSILTGAGPFELNPGQELVVVVEFRPQSIGPLAATVLTGSSCDDIVYQGIGREDKGTITIDAEPNSVNATWQLTGPGVDQAGTGDTTLTNLVPGDYTVTWNAVTGWNAPPQETHYLLGIELFTFFGTYTQCLELVGSVSPPLEAWCVALGQDYAFVADGRSGLQIVDIRNPDVRGLVTTVSIGSGFARGVAVAGNYAYVAVDSISQGDDPGLQVVDISNPRTPLLGNRIPLEYRAFAVTVAGRYAYVAAVEGGLLTFDIEKPYAPDLVDSDDTPGQAWGVVVAGGFVYVADGDNGGLRVFNIFTPSNPQYEYMVDTRGDASGVAIVGNLAYVANGDPQIGQPGLQVVDIELRRLVNGAETGRSSYALAVAGDHVFVADRKTGLRVVHRTNMGLVDFVRTGGQANWVALSGNFAYVANHTSGLQIIDISCYSP